MFLLFYLHIFAYKHLYFVDGSTTFFFAWINKDSQQEDHKKHTKDNKIAQGERASEKRRSIESHESSEKKGKETEQKKKQ